eukprot:UN03752
MVGEYKIMNKSTVMIFRNLCFVGESLICLFISESILGQYWPLF